MKGLPNKWKHAQDELYDRMRGPGNIKDCLYTAYSDKETGGSGLLQLGRAHILKNRVCPTGENCSAVGCERGLRIDP